MALGRAPRLPGRVRRHGGLHRHSGRPSPPGDSWRSRSPAAERSGGSRTCWLAGRESSNVGISSPTSEAGAVPGPGWRARGFVPRSGQSTERPITSGRGWCGTAPGREGPRDHCCVWTLSCSGPGTTPGTFLPGHACDAGAPVRRRRGGEAWRRRRGAPRAPRDRARAARAAARTGSGSSRASSGRPSR